MKILISKLTNPDTVVKIGSANIPIANLKKVWFKLNEKDKDIWEVYTVNKKTMSKCYDLPEGGEYIDYTIRTVSDTAKKYKVLNANTSVWIE
tara:strand:- start:223 stop:498 length:276 start_codon:yes stop_codon:yes gene_type:complete